MAAYWEKAAHSAYDMVSKYKYLIVHFSPPRFLKPGCLSDCTFFFLSDHCLLVPFCFSLTTIWYLYKCLVHFHIL